MFLNPKIKKYISFFIIGMILIVKAGFDYFKGGHNLKIIFMWLLGLIIVSIYFFFIDEREKTKISYSKNIICIVLLLAIFIIPYTFYLYNIPVQVSTDEIVITSLAKQIAHQPNIDIFSLIGLGSYSGYPNLIFYFLGRLAQSIGGINLFHIRLINAFVGLIIIALSYLFFRVLSLSKLYAIGGAIIMGFQHTLFSLSRLAMGNNFPLLIELSALTLFYIGWKHKSLFYTFLGGVVTGLSFYVYFPARIILILWLVFLISSYLLIWSKQQRQIVPKFFSIGIIGFLIMVAPVGLATLKIPLSVAFDYQKSQLIVFSEGMELQKQWIGATTITEGIKINIVNGLSVFTKNLHDQGYIYVNYGHGFLDPLTRILLWLGFTIVLFGLITKNRPETKEQDLLAFSSFLFIWLFFAFLTTKNPSYTRLLIILPFIIYLVLVAIKEIINVFIKILEKFFWKDKIKFLSQISFCLIIISIALWNLNIYKDYVMIGFQQGDDVGSTGRYVEARKNIVNYTFLLATDNQYSYYSWGDSYGWQKWIKIFATDNQKVAIINPQDLFSTEKVMTICSNRSFTLFLNQNLYAKIKDNLFVNCDFPTKIYNIKPDGSLLALEFLE